MKKTVKLLSLVAAFAMAVTMTGCGNKAGNDVDETADNEQKAVLTMATNAEFKPFEYLEGEEIVGADIDMANYESALKHSWEIFFCAIGLLLVFHVDRTKLQFPTAAPFKCQVIKVAVGAAVALGMKSGLKAPLLALLDGNMMAHGIRYFVMILFAGIIWPMTFRWFSQLGRKEP